MNPGKRKFLFIMRAGLMVARSALLLGVLLTLITLGFLYFSGFPSSVTDKIQSSLSDRGIKADIGRLYLNPFTGFVAENVVFFDPVTGRVVTDVSEIKISISLWKLIRKENPVNSLAAKNVALNFPIDPDNPSAGLIIISDTQASGHFVGQKQFIIDSLTGVVAGVRFNLQADLILNPLPFEPKELTEKEKELRLKVRKKIADMLKLISFDREPLLNARLKGDLGDVNTWEGTATLKTVNLRLRDVNVSNLDLSVKMEKSVILLEKFEFKSSAGNLSASGYKHLSEPYAQIHISSDVDITAFSFDLNPDLRRIIHSFEFYQKPTIDISANQNGPGLENINAYGRIHAESFRYQSTYFEILDIPFALENGTLLIPRFTIKDTFGVNTGKLHYTFASRELTGEMQAAINPLNISGLMPANYRKYFLMFTRVTQPLKINLKAEGTIGEDSTLVIKGNVLAENFSLQNIAFDQLKTDVEIKKGKLRCYNGLIIRPEGKGQGEIIYTFSDQILEIKNFKTRLNPQDIATVLGPKSLSYVKPYIFHQTPEALIKGLIDYTTGEKTDITIILKGEKVDYPMTKATLSFDKMQITLRIIQGKCELRDFVGNIYAGQLLGQADFIFEEGRDTKFTMDMTAQDMSFQRLNLALFKYGDATGIMNASGKFNGILGDWALVNGDGKIEITKGKLVSIAFLGPLSTLLDVVVPGFGSLKANKATIDFTMKNGVVKTENLDIAGGGYALICQGFYDIPKDHLKMDARLNVRGIIGAFTFLMSKLFEYEADGTFTDPKWKSKNF